MQYNFSFLTRNRQYPILPFAPLAKEKKQRQVFPAFSTSLQLVTRGAPTGGICTKTYGFDLIHYQISSHNRMFLYKNPYHPNRVPVPACGDFPGRPWEFSPVCLIMVLFGNPATPFPYRYIFSWPPFARFSLDNDAIKWHHTIMKLKHHRTLEIIFSHPASTKVRWRDIEALFRELGANITEREGSRVGVSLFGVCRVFHRPHPSPDTDKGTLASIRKWLEENGVKPWWM